MKYMLDTNTVSDLLRGNEAVTTHLRQHQPDDIVLSAVTEGELRFGLANNPGASGLIEAVHQVLKTIQVLPWDSRAAEVYGQLKANLKKKGLPLAELDMMIAAHSLAVDTTLISSDKAFGNIQTLKLMNWRTPL